MVLPDDDLSRLSPEDLARVRRWVEDRFVNAIQPLALRLDMEMPGTIRADPALQEARRTVDRVLARVEEIRALARGEGGREPRAEGAA